MTQHSRGRRRGEVFAVRLTAEERAELEAMRESESGPRALGPWLVWRTMRDRQGTTGAAVGALPSPAAVVPGPGIAAPAWWYYPSSGTTGSSPYLSSGTTGSSPSELEPVLPRVILDLCGGSGAWSAPYAAAGYDVRLVTLPRADVTTFVPPPNVWGVLAAPPCTEFSLAKNGQPRDLAAGMAVVNACLRVIFQARPVWWALENPVGLLGDYLGTPRDVFQPHDFGDAWTKRTALWGAFAIPERGPFVEPRGSAMDRSTAAERAITPPGFARAFFKANP